MARNLDQRSQSAVDGLIGTKDSSNVCLETNQVGAGIEALGVLAAFTPLAQLRKVLLWSKVVFQFVLVSHVRKSRARFDWSHERR